MQVCVRGEYVCVCVCMRVRAFVRVCVCVCVILLRIYIDANLTSQYLAFVMSAQLRYSLLFRI